MAVTVTTSTENPSHFTFPRTGKRGVPQQFPRRLYEMLDTESKLIEADSHHPKIICWSDSGKAFRIFDVEQFATSVLPRYFRTKKFSSFQRNLNLYGFTKVRRGIDTDMYAHPSFAKDEPEALMQLRKSTTSSSTSRSRSVSDVSSTGRAGRAAYANTTSVNKIIIHGFNPWEHANQNQVSPTSTRTTFVAQNVSESDTSSTGSTDRGKLDLLAFALEQEFARI